MQVGGTIYVKYLPIDLVHWLLRLTSGEQFEWPLPERSPDNKYELATHSARTILAHYQMAVKDEKLSHVYRRLFDCGELQELGKEHCLFRDLSSFAAKDTSELDRRKNSTFHAEDIRSLEMKFAAMMIS